MKFELDTVQKNINGFFKIEKYDEEYYKLMRSSDGKEFSDEYIFSLKERQWTDFAGMNEYHQTSPESHFTKNKICSMPTGNGRVTLTNRKLIITEKGEKQEIEIKDENAFNDKLREYFKISLT